MLATSNPGKLLEFRALLGDLPLSLRALGAFPDVAMPDEGEDYEENARRKARAIARDTGRPAIADDSGIEVSALGGAPGALSARYGGPGLDDAGRVAKVLADLAASGSADRSARFVCWAALAVPGGETFVVQGECVGAILEAPSGSGGFGYDPVFRPDGERLSMAELRPARKNELSHRGRALAALEPILREALALG